MKLLPLLSLLLLPVHQDDIVLLSPMEFEYAPLEVREQLTEMGCSIPQVSDLYEERKHNIISGHFATPEQTDWAAICYKDGKSAVVVLWGGPVNCRSWISALRKVNRTMFDRVLYKYPASRKSRYGDVPVVRTHDAVNYAFWGRAAVAYYCHEGEWIEFVTSD